MEGIRTGTLPPIHLLTSTDQNVPVGSFLPLSSEDCSEHGNWKRFERLDRKQS